MGRRKIPIEPITDTQKRMVTFSKRRDGIRRKALQLCKLFVDIVVCIIVFSPAGKAYTYSNSPLGVCDLAERFLEGGLTKDKKQDNWNVNKGKNKNNSMHCGSNAGVGSGIAGVRRDRNWWDNIHMEELDSVEKLKSAKESLVNLKKNLIARKEKLTASTATSPLSSSSSTVDDSITEDKKMIVIAEDDAEDDKKMIVIVEDDAEDPMAEDRIVGDDDATVVVVEKFEAGNTCTEKYEAGKTCSQGHLNIDLNLYLGRGQGGLSLC